MIDFKSPLDENINVRLQWNINTFKPTATSSFLIKAICQDATCEVDSLLDLGCGIGVVGLTLMKHKIAKNLFASDVSKNAVKLTIENSKLNNIKISARVSDAFYEWEGHKFDIIANDISGVAEVIAQNSSWFKNIPTSAGDDGTANTIHVIKNAKSRLNDGGVLYFPVISLSDEQKIIDCANKHFKNVRKLSSNGWFAPDDLAQKTELLRQHKELGHINFEDKFGKIICYTDIYCARA